MATDSGLASPPFLTEFRSVKGFLEKMCPKEGGHFSEGDRKMRSEMSLPTGAVPGPLESLRANRSPGFPGRGA